MTTAEIWLTGILDCGIADISILDGVEYDIERVIAKAYEFGEKLSLGTVMAAVFDIGRSEIQEAIDERLNELENEMSEEECHENEEYRTLLRLDPFEDTNEFHNFLDTHVWFCHNQEEYMKYLKEACDEFEQNTGFCLFD